MPATHSLRSLADLTVLGSGHINPFCEYSMRAIDALCTRYGIALPAMHHYTSMSSFLFPHTTRERLVTIDLLNALLFYIDDTDDRNHTDRAADRAHGAAQDYHTGVEILVHGRTPGAPHPHDAVWQDLHQRFARLANPAYVQRLATALHAHFAAIRIPNSAFAQPGAADVDTYLAARADDSGMYPTVLLIEFAGAFTLAPAIRDHPVLQQATRLTVSIAALLNDLFSYEKEVLRLGSRFNLVPILMEAHGLTFLEAVDQSVGMINAQIAAFEALTLTMPTWPTAAWNQHTSWYMQGLRDQISAAWYWQLSTNRYRSPTSPFTLLREAVPEEAVLV